MPRTFRKVIDSHGNLFDSRESVERSYRLSFNVIQDSIDNKRDVYTVKEERVGFAFVDEVGHDFNAYPDTRPRYSDPMLHKIVDSDKNMYTNRANVAFSFGVTYEDVKDAIEKREEVKDGVFLARFTDYLENPDIFDTYGVKSS